MKKNFIFLIVLFCCINFSGYASQLIVNLKPEKEIKGQPYAICVKKYDIGFTYGWQYDNIYFSKDGKFNINLETGRYSIAMIYPGCEPFCYNIYIKDKNETVEFNVQLDHMTIPEKIDSVRMLGNFNNYDNVNAIKLKYDAKKKYWYLPNKEIPSNMETFKFIINNEKFIYLLNYPIDSLNTWASPSNLYTKSNKDLIFNPSEYKTGTAKPKVSGTFDTLYNSLCDKLQKLYLETSSKAYQIKTDEEFKDFDIFFQKQMEVLNALKPEYKNYSWATANLEFMMLEIPFNCRANFYKNNNNESAIQKLYKSALYIDQIRKKTQVLSKLELKDLFFTPYIISNIWYNQNEIENYGINDELNLPYGFSRQLLNNLLAKTDNSEIGGEIMKLKAQNLSYFAPESSLKIMLDLKNKYPLYSGNKDGSVAKMITGFSISKGVVAPAFSLVSLEGKTVSLADFKGKYVFLDFWGSWCAPCRGEIPNIKRMSEEIPDSKLVVLGLICHDNEKSYKKFIEENGVKYQNLVATQDVMEKYGIRQWPTTFLISPEGIIIEKDLRGDNVKEQVKSLMKE